METLRHLTEDDWLRLLEATRAVTSTLRLSELLATVMRLASEVARTEASSLLLMDPITGELYFDVMLGEKGAPLQNIRLKKGEGIAGWVAENKKPVIVNDVTKDPRWTQRADRTTAFKTRNLLAVPMQVKDKLVGVMEVINRTDGAPFSEMDARVLETFAAQAAVAIESARLFESVRQEQEKLSMVLAEMTEGVVLLDAGGRGVLVNAAARRWLGLRDAEGFAWAVLEKDFKGIPAWSDIERAPDEGPIEFSRKIPPVFILAGVFHRIRNERWHVKGYLMIVRDVTEERREAQLKKNFLSLISHKLRTPLVALRGYAPMLLEKPEELTPFQKRSIETIDKTSQQLASLIDELIRFTTAESEKPDLSQQPLAPSAIVKIALADLGSYLKDRSADVICESSLASLPPVSADEYWLKEVIRGLVENAVKFNSKPHRTVRIGGRLVKPGHVEIFVADDGPGIPPEEQIKIFQKFYQIEAAFTGQVEGLGLGLALVKRVMNAHGGDVRVDSTLGSGSTFTLSLPAA